jgi:peptide/nickel transport system substrate-binding protein
VGKESMRAADDVRRQQTELGSDVIDEFMAGRISRREFVRRGLAIGIGASALGVIISACGGANSAGTAASGGGAKGGTLKVASTTPSTAMNPLLVSDIGGVAMLTQVGEYLLQDDTSGKLVPMLATSFTPNSKGDVWTFKLREGVRFHNGKALTAKDVAYTFDLHTNPKNGSAALSALKGILSSGQTEAVDDHTVAFHLDTPVGNFPYLVSSDLYNAIILPAGFEPGSWAKTFMGTGPFKLVSYTQGQGAQFARNPSYWGSKARVGSVQFSFYQTAQPQIVALESGTVDVVQQVAINQAQSLLKNSSVHVSSFHSSAYRELHMRCDQAPFTDARVRQALALSLDRPQLLSALLDGHGVLGNDSPFFSGFPSTDKTVPQRKQNLAKAKALLRAAGHEQVSVTLTTENIAEIPQYAEIVQQQAKAVGFDIKLQIETEAGYYGKAVPGQSDWLDSVMGITDYGARGVPNAPLSATLKTGGVWNAAHFANSQYDSLLARYIGAVDLSSQRAAAGALERLLLDETPIVVSYFMDWVVATRTGVSGLVPGFEGQMFLAGATVGASASSSS